MTRSRQSHAVVVSFALMLLMVWTTGTTVGQPARKPAPPRGEAGTARYLESIRDDPPRLRAFLKRMPKGGDLHVHLSGAIYAESFIQWAVESKLCLDPASLKLIACKGATPVRIDSALADATLYRRIIDAWSMRNWELSGQTGHDHFFDTFGKFGMATWGRTGEMLAETAGRAAREGVIYLELMINPDGGPVAALGDRFPWTGDARALRETLLANGLRDSIRIGMRNLDSAEAKMRALLGCGSGAADGCNVIIRYLYQIGRGAPDKYVFPQIVAGFEMAEMDQRVVGFNLVQPEDYLTPMVNFEGQMRMIDAIRPLYRAGHVSLHAGELAFGMVPPDSLCCHIRKSVELAHAERIGHGVDIMYENDPDGLLALMESRRVMVEICLTSNDVILGVRGKDHPFKQYVAAGVPVALATDDLGVARGDMTNELVKAVIEQGVGYLDLKTMARNSLEFAFVQGSSLWKDRTFSGMVPACRSASPGESPHAECQQYLDANPKARLQWKLEEEFVRFEGGR